MRVRVGTAADIDGIIAVREAYCQALQREGLDLAPHDPESTRRFCYRMLSSPDARIFVAGAGETIQGVLIVGITPYPINWSYTMGLELMFFVIEEARSGGLGSGLLASAEQWLESMGASFFFASFRAGLEDYTFFEKRGYVPMEPTVVKRLGVST